MFLGRFRKVIEVVILHEKGLEMMQPMICVKWSSVARDWFFVCRCYLPDSWSAEVVAKMMMWSWFVTCLATTYSNNSHLILQSRRRLGRSLPQTPKIRCSRYVYETSVPIILAGVLQLVVFNVWGLLTLHFTSHHTSPFQNYLRCSSL